MAKTIRKMPQQAQLQRKKRVAAYARVSSGKDAMLHSLSAQVSHYNALIQKESDWEFAGVYADEAMTGTKENRDDFQRLLDDCRSGKVDMIITKSISRLARNTVTLLETVRELKALGVDIYFEEQKIHTMSSDGELMLTILASYAQEESRSTSENMKWRIRKNFEEGIPWQGSLLGYRLQNGQYQIVPDEAEIVKRIYAEYLAGNGVNLICKHLNEDGITTAAGNIWRPQSVRIILRNYTYTGNLLLQKTYRENHITKRTVVNTGQMPQYLAEDTHEAIIPIDTFVEVQEQIARRAKEFASNPPAQSSYPFTGLLICAKCGHNYRRKTTKGKVAWCCSTYNTMGKKYCASKKVPEDTLKLVTDRVTDDISKIDHIEVDDGNVLRYHLRDGRVDVQVWEDRSRAESWTPEMKEAARKKAIERSRTNG